MVANTPDQKETGKLIARQTLEAQHARLKERSLDTRVAQPGLPPPAQMVELVSGFQISQALYVTALLGVADQLVDRPRPVAEVAAAVGAQPHVLRRVLRTLASLGVFEQLDDDTYGLTPLGETLTSTSPTSVLDFVIMAVECGYAAFGELLHTARTGQPAAEHVHGEPFFAWLAAHPEKVGRFTRAMANLNGGIRLEAIPYIDIAASRTVVDVGGADGSMLIEVLAEHPAVRGVVFDLPHVIPAADENLKRHGLDQRVEAVGGDFFDSVPTGDTYLFGFILHDWSDDECVRILDNVRAAGGPGARVRAVEFVVPPGPEPHMAKMIDLSMLGLVTGKERTPAEWAELFARAGFRLERIVTTPTPVSVLEAVAG
jgi:hypothetical protein